jgi:glycosyltransferase involved in cell wall biosynthesis
MPVNRAASPRESRNPSRARERWVQPLLERLDRSALRKSAAVVSLTEDFRRLLSASGWRPREDVSVIPDAFDDQSIAPGDRAAARARLGLSRGAPLVVYAGMTFSYRGLDRLVQAFALLRSKRPHAHLVLVGGRPSEIELLAAQRDRLSLGDAARFTGILSQPDALPFLQAADVLVIPDTVTDVTASPLKLFEYLAVGRAVVLPDLPALREILPPETGYYFRRGDTADMARAMETALDDPERPSREAAGREAVKPFTYAARAGRILALARREARRGRGRDAA